jgi:sortase B
MGHLRIEGTSIDYLVTQTGDNEFYLDHDINKRPNSAGWVFLDYENDITNNDPNTIIYAHNMRRDIRFHSIRRYVSEDFFKTHRYIIFNTLYEDSVWEIFSFYRTDITFPYIQVVFPSEDDFYELLAEMKARSMYDTGVDVGPGDRVLTLSTCVGNREEERYVLNARLVMSG